MKFGWTYLYFWVKQAGWSNNLLGNIIFTDIKTDGALRGPNIEAVQKLLENITTPVIASGGVTTMKDLEKLAGLESLGLEGVIIGKALYTGDIDLAEAIRLYQH